MHRIGKSIGLNGKALQNFSYELFSVEATLEVETKDGSYKLTHVNETLLKESID